MTEQEFQTLTTTRLNQIDEWQNQTTTRLDKIEETLERLLKEQEKLVNNQEKSNLIVETYQKSSQQVVNLAFGLLVTAALAIIIPALINK
jgi:flagellar motility protein MotE (MotC chaperone)